MTHECQQGLFLAFTQPFIQNLRVHGKARIQEGPPHARGADDERTSVNTQMISCSDLLG